MLTLNQKLSQQLQLLPQQILYQKLLQLNNLSLEQKIREELDLNPVLEEVPIEENIQTQEEDRISSETESLADQHEDQIEEIESFTIEDFMNDNPESFSPDYQGGDEEVIEIPSPEKQSLYEQLLNQLSLLNLSPDLFRLGEEIIGNIDEDGYLAVNLEDILKDLELFENIKIPYEKAEKLLKQIQHFEPLGIASRNLQECLLIQLEEKDINPKVKNIARKILSEHFDDFTSKRYESIENKLKINREELKEALNVIQHLNPKPGEGTLTNTDLQQITPDLIVEKVDNKFVVYLNDRNIPQLRINPEYEIIFKKKLKKIKSGDEKELKKFIKEKLDAAKWFIDAIEQRKITLLRVMNMIVEKQKDFFEYGEKHLKPMIYKDIAEPLNLDISTISRVVNGKYVQSPVGIHELKYFFSEGLETENGEAISNKNVKIRIKEIIDNEDKSNPYNDDEIAKILNKEGIKIARRTVAKYREQLGIPVAKLRRQI
ncbi:MAG: RNA polymerase factor sigma-54 [Ignavibacteria bacterium]|jgi:RNA polymerase sigma-54 factor|nr:RNA polymerase factor sigma-54 [Ignavibacteria bacterium]MDH7528538.1 RNA polymerase factor sigma-54 [Ignavibacteria bacterium]